MPEAQALIPPHVVMLAALPPPHRPFANIAPAQAIIAGALVQYTDELLSAAPLLRIISRTGIGLDNVDVPAATRRGVLVCHAPDGPTESTAEHAVAMMLALAKRLKEGDAMMAAGKFGPRSLLLGTEVRDKTVGILGLGRIGRRVAEICRLGLKMKVIAYDPAVTPEQAEELGVTLMDQESVMAGADFLSLHVPLLPATQQLINREHLARMKPGAYLINVARGGVVVEADLLEALESGHLAGAGLDVFDPEPPPEDAPLRRHPQVIVTPHIASSTLEGRRRLDRMAVEAVLDFFRGEKPQSVVNPEVLK